MSKKGYSQDKRPDLAQYLTLGVWLRQPHHYHKSLATPTCRTLLTISYSPGDISLEVVTISDLELQPNSEFLSLSLPVRKHAGIV